VAYEFGFDVVRVEIEELEVGPDEPREFVIEALAGEVAAHINADEAGLAQILREIDREEREPGYRPVKARHQPPRQRRGSSLHPRDVMSAGKAHGPHNTYDEEADDGECVYANAAGSRGVLRLSENATRQLARRIEELIGNRYA